MCVDFQGPLAKLLKEYTSTTIPHRHQLSNSHFFQDFLQECVDFLNLDPSLVVRGVPMYLSSDLLHYLTEGKVTIEEIGTIFEAHGKLNIIIMHLPLSSILIPSLIISPCLEKELEPFIVRVAGEVHCPLYVFDSLLLELPGRIGQLARRMKDCIVRMYQLGDPLLVHMVMFNRQERARRSATDTAYAKNQEEYIKSKMSLSNLLTDEQACRFYKEGEDCDCDDMSVTCYNFSKQRCPCQRDENKKFFENRRLSNYPKYVHGCNGVLEMQII